MFDVGLALWVFDILAHYHSRNWDLVDCPRSSGKIHSHLDSVPHLTCCIGTDS